MAYKIEFTPAQVREINWFGKNVTGLHQEFYKLRDQIEAFNTKLERLVKTADLMDAHVKKLEGGPDGK